MVLFMESPLWEALRNPTLDHRPASGAFNEEDYMSAFYIVESLFYGMKEMAETARFHMTHILYY